MNKIIIVLLIVGGLLFYWYEIRPAQVRSKCNSQKISDYMGQTEEYFYRRCMRDNGLSY